MTQQPLTSCVTADHRDQPDVKTTINGLVTSKPYKACPSDTSDGGRKEHSTD